MKAEAGLELQVIPLKGMTQAAASVMADGSVLLGSGTDGGICRLVPVAFKSQAEALADAEEFQEALQLASYIPDSDVRLFIPFTTECPPVELRKDYQEP